MKRKGDRAGRREGAGDRRTDMAVRPDKSARASGALSRRHMQADATRSELIRAARELFAARGYAAVSISEIACAASATKGAVYHHFANKLELFREVYEIEQVTLVTRLEKAVAAVSDPWARVVGATQAFLDALLEVAPRQIVFIDAPSALGWSEWRKLHARYGLGSVRDLLRDAMKADVIDDLPLEPLAQMVLALADSSSVYLADASKLRRARQDVEQVLLRLLEGLKKGSI